MDIIVTASDVIDAFGLPERSGDTPVSRDFLRECMQSDDDEVLGVIYSCLTEPDYTRRIRPPLDEAEIRPFLQHFMGRSFLRDPRGVGLFTLCCRTRPGWMVPPLLE
jgi:hypothetical protein